MYSQVSSSSIRRDSTVLMSNPKDGILFSSRASFVFRRAYSSRTQRGDERYMPLHFLGSCVARHNCMFRWVFSFQVAFNDIDSYPIVNGKRCLLRLDECSTSMPHPEVKTCGTLSRTLMHQAYKGVLSLMVSLNVCSNYGRPSTPSSLRDVGIR